MRLQCDRGQIQGLLILGLVNCLFWIALALAPMPASAQDQTRIERAEQGVSDNRATLAAVTNEIQSLRTGQTELRASVDRMFYLILGFFITVAGGLASALWSVRRGWLQTTGARE